MVLTDDNDGAGMLHVFDLPQLYTRPSPQVLLSTLTLLTSTPPSWEGSDNEGSYPEAQGRRRRTTTKKSPLSTAQVDSAGLTRYLTSIISSDLKWIADDDVKEQIWEEASLRLSERSGRSAMGDLSRIFSIPTRSTSKAEAIELKIHEPTLTEDNYGFKTWASSYVLARRLHRLDLLPPKEGCRPMMLELGSGTGLVGLAAAAVYGASVLLTDLPEIVSNLEKNAATNSSAILAEGGCTTTATLDWTQPDIITSYRAESDLSPDSQALLSLKSFPVIFAADALYSPEHPGWLVQTIERWLSKAPSARVVVELPLREGYQPELDDFKEKMAGIGLHILQEQEDLGYDDWGWDGSGNLQEVRCWSTVWGWKER